MNREGTARCYLLVAAAYGVETSRANIEAWHLLLQDLDGGAAFAATAELCRRDSPFAPRPGEIIALVRRATGDEPPEVEAALGHYLAGNWDVHPVVAAAARKVHFDRLVMPKEATWQFRALYTAALGEETTRHARAAVKPAEPRPVAEILSHEASIVDVREERP